jgi:hypothetical protein
MNNEESDEQRLERFENEEFARTGVFNANFKIEIRITERDLIKKLVDDTEGKMINPDEPSKN